jgi:DNA-binding ferritin-like protein
MKFPPPNQLTDLIPEYAGETPKGLINESVLEFVKESPTINKAKNTTEILQEILALLRAQYFNYWTSHWQSQGANYYGNHLLFQRLYEAIQEEIDTLAEKIVGYFGNEHVDNKIIMEKAKKWTDQWDGEIVQRALKSEQDLQDALKTAYDKLDKDKSLGLDDFLAATASAHETNLYLLGQLDKS